VTEVVRHELQGAVAAELEDDAPPHHDEFLALDTYVHFYPTAQKPSWHPSMRSSMGGNLTLRLTALTPKALEAARILA
jgi:hypothetical protein